MQRPTRPRSILWFERLMLAAVALGILNTALEWDDLLAGPPSEFRQPALVLGTLQIMFFGAYLLLLWLIAWQGSAIAKWVFVVLVAAAIVLAFVSPPPTLSYGVLPAGIAIAQYLLALVGLELLFRPSAKLWFADRRTETYPDIFS